MTSEKLNDQILLLQKQASVDEMKAKTDLERLFVTLMEENVFYIVAEDGFQGEDSFLPYIAQSSSETEIQFIRIFCSREAAEAYLVTRPDALRIIQVETIDLIQLSKYWLLRDVFGLILNDGNAWCAISFEDFICTFYKNLLETDAYIDGNYMPLIQFCLGFLSGKIENPVYLNKKNTKRKKSYALTPDSENGELFTSESFTPVDLDATIHIDVDLYHLETTVVKLLAAMRQVTEAQSSIQPKEILPAGVIFDKSKEYPYKKIDPRLSFPPEEMQIPETMNTDEFKEKTRTTPCFSKIKTELLSKIKGWKLFVAIVTALLFVVVSIFSIQMLGTLSSLKEFSRNLAKTEYTQAVELYQTHANQERFSSAANTKTLAQIETIFVAYQEDKINAQTAISDIQTLGQIENVRECALQTISKIRLLDLSKTAFQLGCNATESISRLYAWSFVAKEDTSNYEAVQTELSKYGDQYLENAIRYVDAFIQTNNLSSAKAYLDVLNEMFEGTETILNRLSQLEGVTPSLLPQIETLSTEPENNKKQPILIHEITTSKSSVDGAIDLYINWKNTSNQTVSEIDFYVLPYTSDGVITSTRGSSYDLYCARDIGPYLPATGTPSETWKWTGAWINSNIKSAKIQQIIIMYEDGSITSIEGPTAVHDCFSGEQQ